MNDGRLEADHMRLDYRNVTDDEEVMLLLHKRDPDVRDNPVSDVRDGSDTLDTQQEDWLLQTEPLHGARPRRNERERPPVIEDRAVALDLEAAGGVRGRKVDQHGTQAPLLSLERQILLEEELTTPLRGGGASDSLDSGATRRGASRASDFYRGPSTRWWSGPTEGCWIAGRCAG